MRYCKYCGLEISEDTEICPGCGKDIKVKNDATRTQLFQKIPVSNIKAGILKDKRIFILLGLVVIIVIVLCVVNFIKCDVRGCNNNSVSGMRYCYVHKCDVVSCNSMRSGYGDYCSYHYQMFTPSVYSYELEISNVRLSSNSLYSVAEGRITNNSDYTVKFVRIKGAFKNSLGNTIDTDWTYAVGSEGLAPGESCTWEMSVSKDYSIKECTVSILDFDY